MSEQLDRSRSLASSGDYKKAVDSLWMVEPIARRDAAEAQGMRDLALALHVKTTGRKQKGCDRLVALADQHLAVHASLAARGIVRGESTNPDVADDQQLERGEKRTLAFVLGVVGIAVMCVGVFLPLWDSGSVTGFTRIQGNSLLQSAHGWVALATAPLAAISLYRAWRSGSQPSWPLINGLSLIGYAVYTGARADTMTLCSTGENGVALPGTCQIAQPGLGVYAVGAGGVILAVSGLMMLRKEVVNNAPVKAIDGNGTVVSSTTAHAALKRCPDCAELVQPDARICRYCRHEFEKDVGLAAPHQQGGAPLGAADTGFNAT